MSEPGIKHLTDFALLLPFSSIERRQNGTIQYKAINLVVTGKMKKTGMNGLVANTYKSLQNGASQGSGPGGRWFESTRPDHLYRIPNKINILRSAERRFFRLGGRFPDSDLLV